MAATSPPPLSASSSSYSSSSPLPDIHSTLLPDLWGGLTQGGQSKHFPLEKRAPANSVGGSSAITNGLANGTNGINANGLPASLPANGATVTTAPPAFAPFSGTATMPSRPVQVKQQQPISISIPSSPTSVSSASERLSRLPSSASSLGLSTVSLPGSASSTSSSAPVQGPAPPPLTRSQTSSALFGGKDGIWGPSFSSSTLYQSRISASMLKSHKTTPGTATPVLDDLFDSSTASSPTLLGQSEPPSHQGMYRTSSGLTLDMNGTPPAPGVNRHHSVHSVPGHESFRQQPFQPPVGLASNGHHVGGHQFGGPIKHLHDFPLTEENLTMLTRAPSLGDGHLHHHEVHPQFNQATISGIGSLINGTGPGFSIGQQHHAHHQHLGNSSTNPYASYPSTPPLPGLESSVIGSIFDDDRAKRKDEKPISLLTPTGSSNPGTPVGGPSSSSVNGQQRKKNGRPATNTELYKTELCASYMNTGGNCPYGEKCQFAHGEKELKVIDRPPKWRSKPCQNWLKTGTCSYNDRCCFRHDTISPN